MVRRNDGHKKQGKLKDAKFIAPTIDSDEEDEAIFDLGIDENDDDNSGGNGENESDSRADDSEDDEVSEDEDLLNLVEKLPAKIRQKVLSGNAELSDDNDDDEAPEDEGWGKKKKVYWNGDTADLEIGQDMADAEDEEEAAMELQKERQSKLTDGDFFDDALSDGESDDEKETIGHKLKNKSKQALGNDGFTGRLESISLSKVARDDSAVEVEDVPRDISQLSSDQKRLLLQAHSPELLGLAAELRDRAGELRERFAPIQAMLNRSYALRQQILQSLGGGEDDQMNEVVEYITVRQEALLCYCLNTAFYLHLKAQGRSVKSHPVMKQLLKMRYILEKMRPLDARLQPQIDRLLRLTTLSDAELMQQTRLRPNPAALLSREDDDGDEGFDEEKEEREATTHKHSTASKQPTRSALPQQTEASAEGGGGLYRAPRISAAPYAERESNAEKQLRKLEKQRKRLKNSELVQALQDEFGDVPERLGSGGGVGAGEGAGSSAQKELEDEQNQRLAFEEDRFVRTTLSRADKKSLKQRAQQAARLDNFEDIGDVGDLDHLMKAAASSSSSSSRGDGLSVREVGGGGQGKGVAVGEAAAKNMRKTLGSLVDSSSRGNKRGGGAEEDDENEFDRLLAGNSKRNRDSVGSGGDDGDDVLEQFAKKKKDFIAQKKAQYIPEPRYGGIEEAVENGDKRPASYEIIKNKGLTPHRKKANRNPRVKKREMFDKKVKARKGQVQDVITGRAGSYAGENTGIKANISKSRRII